MSTIIIESENITLKDWLSFHEWRALDQNPFLEKLLTYEVIENVTYDHPLYNNCPIKRKNIYHWCIVTNGIKKYAVAFNENPSIGYSWPHKLLK